MQVFRLSILLVFIFSLRAVVAEDLRIPVLVGQTGSSATFGRNETDAYTLAAEECNLRGGVSGKRVILDFEDTETSGKKIISAFHLHASKGAKVMMGPTWLDGFPAVIPIAQKNGVLLVTPNAAIEAFTDKDRGWPVTFYHNSTTEIKVLVKALQTRGFSRIALIFEQEPFAEMMRRLLKSELSSLVADIGIQGGEGDFHSSLLKLRQRRIDALVIFVWNQRSLLSLLQQLRMNLPNVQLASVHDGAGWLLDSAFRAQINRLLYTKFLVVDSSFEDRFRTRFGYSPILTASNAYDALNAVLSAIAAGAKSAQSIRDHLTKKEIDSVTFGKFRFNNDGSVPSKVDIVDYAQEKANGDA